MPYLWFVTLNNGSADRIAPPDAVVTATPALDLGRALRDGRTGITGRSGYELQALTVGAALLCTVWRGSDLPLTTFAVAARPRSSDRLWRMMHETSAGYGLATSADDAPEPPWCAVRVEPGLLSDPDAPWRWLAAYEVEIATAWIEKRHRNA